MAKTINSLKKAFGFTIVELLIIVSVIGILAGIGSYSYISYINNANDTKRSSDIASLSSALEAYFEEKGQYPSVATITSTNVNNLSTLLKVDKEVFRSPSAAPTTVTSIVNYDDYITSTADLYRYEGISTDAAECKTNTSVETAGEKHSRRVASLGHLAVGTAAGYCESFKLSWFRQSDNTWQYVYSLH